MASRMYIISYAGAPHLCRVVAVRTLLHLAPSHEKTSTSLLALGLSCRGGRSSSLFRSVRELQAGVGLRKCWEFSAAVGREKLGVRAMSKSSLQEMSDGEFKRTESQFRHFVSREPGAEFSPEKGRYHLYISYACPWASRCYAFLKLKGLEHAIGVTVSPIFPDCVNRLD